MAIEYKDVTVSLNVWGKVPAGGIGQQEAARQASIVAAPNANAAILDTLNREGAQGWQPADANTDLYGVPTFFPSVFPSKQKRREQF